MYSASPTFRSIGPRQLLKERLLVCTCVGLLLGGCAQELNGSDNSARSTEQSVVYGDDNRLDYYEATPAFQDLTRQSIVALMRRSGLDRTDADSFTPTGRTLGQRRNLCEGERFAEQPAVAFCSGTLIAPDLVLTAGHCVESQSECLTTELVFNYYYTTAEELETITADDVFTCRTLVAQVNTDDLDYAILQLDRPVGPDRAPVAVRTADAPLEVGAGLTVVGFGSGLPAKVDSGGIVTDNRSDEQDYFQATLDTFGGNSGSGIFDETRTLVGILVRGETDYITVDGCQRVNVLSERNRTNGEDGTYVGRALEHLCTTPFATDELCPSGQSFVCGACSSDDDCQGGRRCLLPTEGSGAEGSGMEGSGVVPPAGICVESCTRDRDCPGGTDLECVDGVCVAEAPAACVSLELRAFERCAPLERAGEACDIADRCVEDACVPRLRGDRCETATEIPTLSARYEPLQLAGFSDLVAGSCAGAGAERVFSFRVDAPMQLVAQAGSVEEDELDTVLYLRSGACDELAAEIACRDDSTPPGDNGSRLNVVLQPGEYFLFFDSYEQSDADGWLELTFTPACQASCEAEATRCSNGLPQRCDFNETLECGIWRDRPACSSDEECVAGECVEVEVEEPDVVDDVETDNAGDADTFESDASSEDAAEFDVGEEDLDAGSGDDTDEDVEDDARPDAGSEPDPDTIPGEEVDAGQDTAADEGSGISAAELGGGGGCQVVGSSEQPLPFGFVGMMVSGLFFVRRRNNAVSHAA
jgi:V8-like Glu-specific endopeptidase